VFGLDGYGGAVRWDRSFKRGVLGCLEIVYGGGCDALVVL
jgi:hypothetical protein